MCAWLWERRLSPASHREARFSDAPGMQVLMAESEDQGTDWKSKGKSKGIEMGNQADAIVIFFTVPPPSPALLFKHPSSGFIGAGGIRLGITFQQVSFPITYGALWLWGESYFWGCLIFWLVWTQSWGSFFWRRLTVLPALPFLFTSSSAFCSLSAFWCFLTAPALPCWHPGLLPVWALYYLLWTSSISGSGLHFFSTTAFSLSFECEISLHRNVSSWKRTSFNLNTCKPEEKYRC